MTNFWKEGGEPVQDIKLNYSLYNFSSNSLTFSLSIG